MDFDFAHVAHVEQAGGRPNRSVLFQNAGILEGHLPAAKVDHFGSHAAMRGVEGGGLERIGKRGHFRAKRRGSTREAANGRVLVRKDVDHLIELGELHHVLHARRQLHQLYFAPLA